MRIEVDRRQFIDALTRACPALDRRRGAPDVLSMMRMRVNGALSVEATDLDIEICSHVSLGEGQQDGEGDFVIAQPVALRDALKLFDAETLAIEGEADGRLKLTGGNQTAVLTSEKVRPDDFPNIAPPGIGSAMRVGVAFEWALRRLLPAVSVEETRYYLNGIAIAHLGDWAFRLAATDGHRLHVAQVEIPDATGPFWAGDLIVSRQTLKQILPLLSRAKDGASIAFGQTPRPNSDETALTDAAPKDARPSRVQFAADGAVVTGRLIDGSYPDYMRVVPDTMSRWIEVDRRALIRAVRLASAAMPGSKYRSVRMTMTAGWTMEIASTEPERASGITASTAVAVQHAVGFVAGDYAGFNGSYLVDTLNSFVGEIVRFAWPDGDLVNTPCRIDDPTDEKFFAVLMPMRV